MKLKYYDELDGVRAIAALMIMFFHFFHPLVPSEPLLAMIRRVSFFGQTGVSLFFVLSGFLITRILLSTKGDSSFFKNFYSRRALRIFPLYFFFLAVSYFVIPVLMGGTVPAFSEQIYFWTYLQNFAFTFNWPAVGPQHFWSLAVEEHFYLFWPLLVFFFNERKIVFSILLIVVGAIVVRAVLTYNSYDVFYFTFARMDELAVGSFLAILEKRGKLVSANTKKFLVFTILIIIPTLVIWTFFTGDGVPVLQIFKFNLLALFYFGAIGWLLTLSEAHPLKKVLRNRFFLFSGKISYGLYVYHPISFLIVKAYLFPEGYLGMSFLFSFLLTYVIATSSYYLLETRFLAMKKYFVEKNTYDTSNKTILTAKSRV